MSISLQKTIPKVSTLGGYSIAGGGAGTTSCTITLSGVTEMTLHTKKTLIKIQIPKSKTTQTSGVSDKFANSVVDLKRGTDEIKIRGWLEDTPANDSSVDCDGNDETAATTAWEKFWILRSMCSRGGSLTNLTIENVSFTTSTQEAFLEDIVAVVQADDTGVINTSSGGGDVARVNIDLTLFIGDER